MKTRTSSRESTVGCLMLSGGVTILIGLGLTVLFTMGGVFRGTYTRDTQNGDRITDAGTLNLVPLTITFITVGALIVIGGLVYGGWFESRGRKGQRSTVSNLKILARNASDRQGNLLVSEWEIEAADRPRFYVRAVLPTGEVDEYEVSEAVYLACGEGMTGTAEVQGRWIGRFTPHIGDRPPG